MAIAMQKRLLELNIAWRARGIDTPFRARMGINTGYCNVGNFGSEDRMDYTIIGAEANLAARLQSNAQPGGIVLSYETWSLVKHAVRARQLEPITMKGISQPVVPYEVELDLDTERPLIEPQNGGLFLRLDLAGLDTDRAARLEARLLELVAEATGRPA